MVEECNFINKSLYYKRISFCFGLSDIEDPLAGIFKPLNVTTSGHNCNTIFDVLTSKMPNADRSKYAFVCVWDFVWIYSGND